MSSPSDPRSDFRFTPVWQFLLDRAAVSQLRDTIDWDTETKSLTNPTVHYPEDYFQSQTQNGGYLSADGAAAYDAIAQYSLPPNETWVRQGLIDTIQGVPRRILDVGCGTGSTTVLLKQAFPSAEVIGLDLSPYLLVMAQRKAHAANSDIVWRHGLAQRTGLPSAAIDVVTASFLLDEIPQARVPTLMQEWFRVLTPGGQVILLEGGPTPLHPVTGLMQWWERHWADSVASQMAAVGFEAVRSHDHWMVYSITRGMKPLPADDRTNLPLWGVAVAG